MLLLFPVPHADVASRTDRCSGPSLLGPASVPGLSLLGPTGVSGLARGRRPRSPPACTRPSGLSRTRCPQRRNTGPGRTSADLMDRWLNRRIGCSAEPIHRSADRQALSGLSPWRGMSRGGVPRSRASGARALATLCVRGYGACYAVRPGLRRLPRGGSPLLPVSPIPGKLFLHRADEESEVPFPDRADRVGEVGPPTGRRASGPGRTAGRSTWRQPRRSASGRSPRPRGFPLSVSCGG